MVWGTLPESMRFERHASCKSALAESPVASHTRTLLCCGPSRPPAEPFMNDAMALRTSSAIVAGVGGWVEEAECCCRERVLGPLGLQYLGRDRGYGIVGEK